MTTKLIIIIVVLSVILGGVLGWGITRHFEHKAEVSEGVKTGGFTVKADSIPVRIDTPKVVSPPRGKTPYKPSSGEISIESLRQQFKDFAVERHLMFDKLIPAQDTALVHIDKDTTQTIVQMRDVSVHVDVDDKGTNATASVVVKVSPVEYNFNSPKYIEEQPKVFTIPWIAITPYLGKRESVVGGVALEIDRLRVMAQYESNTTPSYIVGYCFPLLR